MSAQEDLSLPKGGDPSDSTSGSLTHTGTATITSLIKEILPEEIRCSNEARDIIVECCVGKEARLKALSCHLCSHWTKSSSTYSPRRQTMPAQRTRRRPSDQTIQRRESLLGGDILGAYGFGGSHSRQASCSFFRPFLQRMADADITISQIGMRGGDSVGGRTNGGGQWSRLSRRCRSLSRS